MTITAAVDGSALGNPGPAGWAWVVDADTWAAGGWPKATNNIGELTALLELLEDTAEAGFADQDLVVLADSQYVINSVTRWMPNWRARGWKKADGKPVANLQLMQDLDAALRGRNVRFEWVKGHAGHPLNEEADTRARQAAESYQQRREPNRGPGFGSTVKLNSALGVPPPGAKPMPTRRLAATPDQLQQHYGFADSTEPKAPVLDAIAASEVPDRWEEVMASAESEPLTVSRRGAPPLVLLDADLAWQALAALDEQEGSVERSLF